MCLKAQKILNRVGLLALLFLCLAAASAFAATPTLGTISPSYGSTAVNTPVTFTASYSDASGYAHLNTVRLLINKSLTSINAVYVHYNQNSNKLYLLSDDGKTWLGGYVPGSANTIENSYGKLNCASTTVTSSGSTITVKWNITFKPAFAATALKNLYLYATDDASVNSGFAQKGTRLIGTNTAPAVGTLSPASGSIAANTAVTFTATYTDINTYQNLQTVRILINKALTSVNSVYAYYNQNTNKLYLLNDAGSTWLGGFTPGSGHIIENTYGKLDCSGTTVTSSGNTLTVKWKIIFKDAFIGAQTKGIWLYATDDSNANSGLVQKGAWLVDPNTAPTVGTIAPASGSAKANIAVSFRTTYTDANGYKDLNTTRLLINRILDSHNAVYLYYNQNSNKLYLLNDAGTSWLGGFAPGSSNIIENTYGKLDCSATTVTASGNTITVNWKIIFNGAFVGTKNCYLYATDDSVANSGMIKKGTWEITSAYIPTVEEALQKVVDNYALVQDFKADMILTSTLNGQPFGTTEYCRYYFKAPNKEKTESFTDASRLTKTDIMITNGSNMHLINLASNTKETVDLLTDAGINATQFNQMDLYYNQPLFLNSNIIVRDNSSSDLNNMIISLDVIPNTPNNIYDKLSVCIDYYKGIITKHSIYKKDTWGQISLVQEIKTLDSQQMPNGAWLPIKMEKTPNLASGTLISTLIYNNLQINAGLADLDFDPDRQ